MLLRSLTGLTAALFLSGCDFPGSPVAIRLEEAKSSAASDIVFLEMISAREIRIGEKVTTPDALLTDLKTYLGEREPEDVRILVQPDPSVAYEDVVVVFNTLQDAGYTRIGLIKPESSTEQ
jgi:biopolymer transport protein ExbD